MSLRFWVNTFLALVTPGGYGYERVLRRHQRRLVAGAGARPRTKEEYETSPWGGPEGDGIRRREYKGYDEYVEHQSSKFDEIIRVAGGLGNRLQAEFRLHFYGIFKDLPRRLPPDARILCAGARQGTEVEVLRELGFRHAVGIDLNPGPDNPYVVPGDFMKLDAADGSLDLVYSNALDHAFDLRGFFAEHARALKPTGYALYEIALVKPSSFEALEWESAEQVKGLALEYFGRVEQSRVTGKGSWETVLLADPRPRR